MNVRVTGIKQLDRRLKKLAKKDARRIGRQAINKGLTVISKQIKSKTPKGPTGNLKKSVGKRNKKNKRKGIQEAKAGFNVGLKNRKQKPGSKRKPKRRAQHAHLYTIGTQSRKHKSGKSVGRMPGNNIISVAYRASAKKSIKVMTESAKQGIKKLKK